MKQGEPMPSAQSVIADANGFLWLDRARYHTDLAADVPENVTRVLAAAQVPIAAKAFNEPVDQVGWKDKPSWYVLTTKDRAVSPALQKAIAGKIRCASFISGACRSSRARTWSNARANWWPRR